MSSQYLFPCEKCNREFNVDTSAAGRQVNCPFCKNTIDLPKLSQLREMQLEKVSDDSEDMESSGSLGVGQTWMFVCGVPILLIGLIAGAVLMWQATNLEDAIAKDQATLEQVKGRIDSYIDQYGVEQTWKVWHEELLPNPPGAWEQPVLSYAAQNARVKRLFSYTAFGFAALGLGLIGISFLLGEKKSK